MAIVVVLVLLDVRHHRRRGSSSSSLASRTARSRRALIAGGAVGALTLAIDLAVTGAADTSLLLAALLGSVVALLVGATTDTADPLGRRIGHGTGRVR